MKLNLDILKSPAAKKLLGIIPAVVAATVAFANAKNELKEKQEIEDMKKAIEELKTNK